MNIDELPLTRACSCGEILALLHEVWDPDTGQIEYQMALEGAAEQFSRSDGTTKPYPGLQGPRLLA